MKIGFRCQLFEITKLKQEIQATMDKIKILKNTESTIERLQEMNKSINTASAWQNNQSQLTFQIIMLNEQMKLLVEY